MFFKKNNDILNVLTTLESYLKDEFNYLPDLDFSNSYIRTILPLSYPFLTQSIQSIKPYCIR